MGLPTRIDHVVIHVSDWDAARRFYVDVLGAEAVSRGDGFVFRFGDVQFNVHGPGVEAAPLARRPVEPGNSDLCLCWDGPVDEAQRHLASHGVPIELGPVARHGRGGRGLSLYFRDPDGSLIEFISYGDVAT